MDFSRHQVWLNKAYHIPYIPVRYNGEIRPLTPFPGHDCPGMGQPSFMLSGLMTLPFNDS